MMRLRWLIPPLLVVIFLVPIFIPVLAAEDQVIDSPDIQDKAEWHTETNASHYGGSALYETYEPGYPPFNPYPISQTFTGKGFTIYGMTSSDSGYCQIQYGDTYSDPIDLYSAETQYQVEIFHYDGWEYGSHKVYFRTVADKNPASSSYRCTFDYLTYDNTAPTPTVTLTSIPSPTATLAYQLVASISQDEYTQLTARIVIGGLAVAFLISISILLIVEPRRRA